MLLLVIVAYNDDIQKPCVRYSFTSTQKAQHRQAWQQLLFKETYDCNCCTVIVLVIICITAQLTIAVAQELCVCMATQAVIVHSIAQHHQQQSTLSTDLYDVAYDNSSQDTLSLHACYATVQQCVDSQASWYSTEHCCSQRMCKQAINHSGCWHQNARKRTAAVSILHVYYSTDTDARHRRFEEHL
eukprot:18038-Heterococcus_DN1.PRE.5